MEARFALNITRGDLVEILKELAEIYERVCMGSGSVPSTTLLDTVEAFLKAANPEAVACQRKRGSAIKILSEVDKHEYQSDHVFTDDRLLDTIRDQLRHLKEVVDVITVVDPQNDLHTENQDSSFVEEVKMEKTLSLESLLSIKNEQIATLRDVLKATKETAEMAFCNLKSKYENEKAIVSETLMKLRYELNVLKECKTSFVTLRSLFAERCEQLITQLNELQMELIASEEEIKRLNLLLNRPVSPETTSLTTAD